MKKIFYISISLCILLSGCVLIRPMTYRDHKEFEREKERQKQQEEPYIPIPKIKK